MFDDGRWGKGSAGFRSGGVGTGMSEGAEGDLWLDVTRPHGGEDAGGALCHVVIENVQVGVVVFGLEEHSIMTANRQAEVILGSPIDPEDFDELIGLFGLHDPVEHAPVCPDQRNIVELEGRTIGYSTYGIEDGYCCVLFQDITERMRLEAVAESMNLAENIGFVFSALRHELGNPLASIKMGLIVLKNRLEDLGDEGILGHVDALLEDVGRTEAILRSMKSYGMRDAVTIEDMDIAAETKSFIAHVRDRFDAAGVSVEYEGPDKMLVRGDPRALGQVFLNLVSNASAALEGRPNPRIFFRLERIGNLAVLSVEDNGKGLSQEQAAMAFRPFYTTKKDGSGLGLVICRKLLAKMGGTIDLNSEPNLGTTLTIRLPLFPGAGR